MKPAHLTKPAPKRAEPNAWRTPAIADACTAIIVTIDQAMRDSEARWGVGRLVNLISADTLLSFRRGMDAYNAAISAGDVSALRSVAEKMKSALAYMDAEASAAGHQPLAPVTWETELSGGRVLCIVRTGPEALAVARQQAAGREVVVYTLDEVARLLEAQEAVNAVKLAFPGAKVERVVKRDASFTEDWVTADPLIDHLYPEVEAV